MQQGDVTILVVDDVEAMRQRLKDILTNLAFKNIFTAESPMQALQMLTSNKIHLILCDWNMAPVDGKEFLLQLKKDSSTESIPFIMVTAEASFEKVADAIMAGVDDYLVKPFSQEQLEAKVQGVLKKKQVLG